MGDYSVVGNASLDTEHLITKGSPVSDPLRFLAVPDKHNLVLRSSSALHFTHGASVLKPGIYHGGIEVSGKAAVTLEPGVYYLDGGGFRYSGQATLTAESVLLYNDPLQTQDGIQITGQGSVTLGPLTSGPYQGIAVFQRRNANSVIRLTGQSRYTARGMFYAAGAPVDIVGQADATIASQFISRTLVVHGNAVINVEWEPNLAPLGCPQ